MKRLRRPKDLAAIGRRQILTTSQAAELCAVDRRTMLNWVKSGRMRGHKTGGGQNRVLLADVLAFMQELGMPVPEGVTAAGRVAVVDGDKSFIRKVDRLIQRDAPGTDVRSASDGFSGGALVASFLPHLLLVDTSLPGIDGAELVRWTRDNERTRDCAIVITTNGLDAKDQGKLTKAGATTYLDRAAEGTQLSDLIAQHLPARLASWTSAG